MRTGKDKINGQGLLGSRQVNTAHEATKANEQKIVKPTTVEIERVPAGKCRFAVRGFSASILRSVRRLNAIAAERANTMQAKMPSRSIQRNGSRLQANVALKRANGNANSV